MLIDSHAHMTSERFDRDRDKVIRDFQKDGLEMVITAGSSMRSSDAAARLAKQYKNIYATVGVHPCATDEMDDTSIPKLRELTKNEKVVAIGEIGLDYHWQEVPHDVQKKWFIAQMDLAKEVGLPIMVHDREANLDTYNMIKSMKDDKLTGVLHCYSGDVDLAWKYVDMGFYLSIAGPVTYRTATKLQRVAKEIPLEYLFIETDCPSLTPGPAGRRRNEPAFVRYIAATIAELRGVPFHVVEKQTNANVKKLFNRIGR